MSTVNSTMAKMAPILMSAPFYAFDAYSTYKSKREEGQSRLGAGVSAGLNMLAWELPVTKPFMLAGMVNDMAHAGASAAHNLYYQNLHNRRDKYMGNFGGRFEDNDIRATMRQRGLAAIQESRLNARTILGSEARALHRRGDPAY